MNANKPFNRIFINFNFSIQPYNYDYYYPLEQWVVCVLTVPVTAKASCVSFFFFFYANSQQQVGLFIGWNHSQIPLRNYLIENQGGEKKREQQVWCFFYTALLFWLFRKGFGDKLFFLLCASHPKNKDIIIIIIINLFITAGACSLNGEYL